MDPDAEFEIWRKSRLWTSFVSRLCLHAPCTEGAVRKQEVCSFPKWNHQLNLSLFLRELWHKSQKIFKKNLHNFIIFTKGVKAGEVLSVLMRRTRPFCLLGHLLSIVRLDLALLCPRLFWISIRNHAQYLAEFSTYHPVSFQASWAATQFGPVQFAITGVSTFK